MKHKLVFDTTDAATISASDKVGAVLYDAANDRLAVINASQQLEVHDADVLSQLQSGVVVSATDLDIRDLSASQDSVAISDGTDTLAVNADGSINAVVTATQLDIDDLNATDDAVAAWLSDGSGNAISSTGGSLDVNVTNDIDIDDSLANTAMQVVAETVGTSAAQILDGADELADRKWMYLYNNANKAMYIGPSGVSTSSGFPLFPGSMLELRIGAAVDVYAIGDGSSLNMRTMQLS